MKGKILLFLLAILLFSACNNQESAIGANDERPKPQQFSYPNRPEEIGMSALKLAKIDSVIEGYVQKGILPNAVTFIARHGQIIHNKAYGYKNIEQKILLRPNDIFRIASQTKAFTTLALMMLWEEGKFRLDDPVEKYIPQFANAQVIEALDENTGQFRARPAQKKVTIRHLLSHTAGIPYGSLYARDSIPFFNSLKPENLAGVVPKIATKPLMHEPGERYTYGLSTDVCGYLVEIFSGMTLADFFQQRIFAPLGIKDTHFYLPADKADRLVVLYAKPSETEPLKPSDVVSNQTFAVSGAKTYYSGGAGLVGTIEDYAKLCQLFANYGEFNGVRLLSRKTVETMLVNHIGENEVWDRDNKFGLGFELVTEEGIQHVPGTVGSFRWGGMYYTDYTIDPKEGLIMLFYTNVHPFANPGIHEQFRTLVYSAVND